MIRSIHILSPWAGISRDQFATLLLFFVVSLSTFVPCSAHLLSIIFVFICLLITFWSCPAIIRNTKKNRHYSVNMKPFSPQQSIHNKNLLIRFDEVAKRHFSFGIFTHNMFFVCCYSLFQRRFGLLKIPNASQ